MSNAKHHKFDTLYRRFADYGREIPTDGTEKCPDEITLAMSALLRLVGVVDDICVSIARNELNRVRKEVRTDCERSCDKWVADLEDRHGPAPDSVRNYVIGLVFQQVEHVVSDPARWYHPWKRTVDVHPCDMPAEVRNDYDRWRKRKAKKESAK